jgi:hypothetical protein
MMSMSCPSWLAGHRAARSIYQPPPLPTDGVKLAALRAAFPEFGFTITVICGRRCWLAVRLRGDGALVSVACVSGIELWRVLRRADRALVRRGRVMT